MNEATKTARILDGRAAAAAIKAELKLSDLQLGMSDPAARFGESIVFLRAERLAVKRDRLRGAVDVQIGDAFADLHGGLLGQVHSGAADGGSLERN